MDDREQMLAQGLRVALESAATTRQPLHLRVAYWLSAFLPGLVCFGPLFVVLHFWGSAWWAAWVIEAWIVVLYLALHFLRARRGRN